jgi:hypothetical protein
MYHSHKLLDRIYSNAKCLYFLKLDLPVRRISLLFSIHKSTFVYQEAIHLVSKVSSL